MRALADRPVHLVGWSAGGSVAMRYAIDHPGAVAYFRPPFRAAPEREEAYLDSMLATVVGEDHYPGDLATSANWPGVAPGDPRDEQRGADDQIVSDTSLFDLGYLGKLGAVPGWPGDDAYPPQPMLAQMRATLGACGRAGGDWREEVLEACGHSPHVERPRQFMDLLLGFLGEAA